MQLTIKVRQAESPYGTTVYYPMCENAWKFQQLTKVSNGQLSRPALNIIRRLGVEVELVSEVLKGVYA